MIDVNRDGYVDRDDLQDIMVSLGEESVIFHTHYIRFVAFTNFRLYVDTHLNRTKFM